MTVRKVKGRQLARVIALIYISLWVMFVLLMGVTFSFNELLGIDLLIPLIVTTIIDLSLSSILYISSYKIKLDNNLSILYGFLGIFSIIWYLNWIGVVILILFIIAIVIIKFGVDD